MDNYYSVMTRCQNCGRSYNAKRLRKCPVCAVANATQEKSELLSVSESSNKVAPPASPDTDSILEFLQEVIYAQNRTTHAVRAVVRFLFIQLAAITLAWFLYFLANDSVDVYECSTRGTSCNPNGFLTFIAAAVWLVGLIISSNIGWKELNSSDIPGEHSGNPYRY